MLKTFYIQKNEEDIITDILEFSHADYIEAQLNTPIPPRIMSGCYKLVNGNVVYVESLDKDKLLDKISNLEKENADLLLDSASKDIKIKTVEQDVSDLTLLIAQGGM